MVKDHMRNPDNPKRTRCGQPIGNLHGPRIIAWEYGSPKTTCKSCLRLYVNDPIDNASVSELELRKRGAFRELLRGDD